MDKLERPTYSAAVIGPPGQELPPPYLGDISPVLDFTIEEVSDPQTRKALDIRNLVRLVACVAGFVMIGFIVIQMIFANTSYGACRSEAGLVLLKLWMGMTVANTLLLMSVVMYKERGVPFFILFHLILLLCYLWWPVPKDPEYTDCFIKDPRVVAWVIVAHLPHIILATLIALSILFGIGALLYNSGIFRV